jgi:2-methylcitrate dehydratase PrpD
MVLQNAASGATLSERLAQYICKTSIRDLDHAAREQVKHIFVHHVGLALRSVRLQERDSAQAARVAGELSETSGSSRLLGRRERATLADAAMANCTAMRAGGLDDVIFPAGIHPGLVTLPVALAVAERHHASGGAFINAVATAYEILGKFGRWTWSLENPRRATMLFGPFGSIVTAGKLLNLDTEQLTRALGYAVHMAMGVAESDGGPVTHFYSLVCRNGLTGAYLARAGGWASSTAIEGRYGFLDAFFGGAVIDPNALIDSLGRDFVIHDSCEKRYPGTAANQVPIELMRDLVLAHNLRAEDVESLRVDLPVERKNFDGDHLTGHFTSRAQAVSSCAFQLAIVLTDGYAKPSRYDEYDDPRIQSLTDRMRFRYVTGKPIRYARLELSTTAGRLYVEEGQTFRHPPEPARTIVEREGAGILPRDKIEKFLEFFEHLEEIPDMAQVVECLTP